MNRSTALIVIFLVFSILEVMAVDRGKFKKCDQNNFCKRNRKLADQSPDKLPSYSVISNDLKRGSESKYVGNIKSPHSDTPLPMELIGLDNGVLRLRIFEKDNRRYMGPQDLLMPLNEAILQEESKNDKSTTFRLQNSRNLNYKAVLHNDPFKLELFVDNQLVLTANNRNLFNFEHLRTRELDNLALEINDPSAQRPDTWDDSQDGVWEAPKIANPEADGRWEESFGSHRDSKPRGPSSIGMDFTFHDSNNVYGIPEHAHSFSLKPTKTTDNKVLSDPYRLYNLDVFEYELNNEMALYGSVPFMISHNPKHTVGVLWFNAAETWIDVAHGNTGIIMGSNYVDTHWISESGIIDVFFFFGPRPADLFAQYGSISGTTPIPPVFSLAYHQCKWNYKDQKEVAEVDSSFDNANIPYDVIWLDIEHTDAKKYFTWDRNHFAEPDKMQKEIAEKGRKIVTIVDPHIKRDDGYYIHKAAEYAGDLYVKNHEGRDYEGHCWPGSSSWIDYTNPKARNWWAEKFSYESYQQSTPTLFTWNDMNEPSVFSGPEVTMHKDAKHFGDLEHRDVHNAYGLYMQMSTAMGLVSRNSGLNERPFVLSRAFFVGSQRYGAIWTGDNAGKWDHLEIAQPMLLSLGVAGISFSGADVGGFFGNPEPELLARWYQAGAFHPFFRAHGHLDSKRREPFLHPEPYQSIMRDAIRARYAFLPYVYTTFHQNYISGVPAMRPLWVEYPEDTSIFEEDKAFLLGKDLMVKPVTASGQTSISVYFPGVQPWYDFNDNVKYSGGSTATISTPLEKIPVFQRGGSIIPKKERVRRSSTQMANDPYTLVVALNKEGAAEGELYVDDGHSFNYANSKEFLKKRFRFQNNVLSSTNIHDKYKPSNTLERVVIYGLAKKPTRVVLEVPNSKPVELQFTYENEKLTVRKPDCKVADEWKILVTL